MFVIAQNKLRSVNQDGAQVQVMNVMCKQRISSGKVTDRRTNMPYRIETITRARI